MLACALLKQSRYIFFCIAACQTPLFLATSALAEFIADIDLCPLEAVKVHCLLRLHLALHSFCITGHHNNPCAIKRGTDACRCTLSLFYLLMGMCTAYVLCSTGNFLCYFLFSYQHSFHLLTTEGVLSKPSDPGASCLHLVPQAENAVLHCKWHVLQVKVQSFVTGACRIASCNLSDCNRLRPWSTMIFLKCTSWERKAALLVSLCRSRFKPLQDMPRA